MIKVARHTNSIFDECIVYLKKMISQLKDQIKLLIIHMYSKLFMKPI